MWISTHSAGGHRDQRCWISWSWRHRQVEGSEHSYTLSHLSSLSQDPGRAHNSVTEHLLSARPSGSIASSEKKMKYN